MKPKIAFYSCLAAVLSTFWFATPPAQANVTVTVQPTNQVVLVGSNAVFNALVSTTAGEVVTGYTWLMSTISNTPPFYTLPGATNATCTLTNVQTTNAGYYFAKVAYAINGTNSGVTVPSGQVILIVTDQARIITQPQGGLIRSTGTNVSFSVTALGSSPLGYQWRMNGTNLANGPRITGANGTNLTLTALVVADSGSYDVVVTNLYSAATSQVATLSVFAPPGISLQPQDLTILTGSNANFSVTPSGSAPFGFRWRKNGTALSNGGRISGATSNSLTIAAAITNDAGGYSVVITNPVGSVTSTVATLTVLVPPTITSATTASGRQGLFFSFTITATGTPPITFGADGLPAGLSLQPTNGVISGTPAVMGVFNVAIYATNAALTTTGQLTLTLTTGVPGITSATTASGKQGTTFSYTIQASNNPVVFSASGLPPGVNFNPTNGVISGPSIVNGVFPVAIGVANQYGSDSRVLTLTIASALPVITSATTATGTENQTNFQYIIQASNTNALTEYGAAGLPIGLTVNTTNGVISGTPLYGGTYNVPIWAINAWGTGTTNLVLTISYAPLGGLAITNVAVNYTKPYLLSFSFSLVDNSDPSKLIPVVRLPSEIQLLCMEDGVDITSRGETKGISDRMDKISTYAQRKICFVLDYTYSMYASAGAIDSMQSAAETFVNMVPANVLFGICEFHADYVAPNMVTNWVQGPGTNLVATNFTSDKATLIQSIQGIQTNYVHGNYAGSRCWDAIQTALIQSKSANVGQFNYLVVMSDGNDDSSLLNTNADPVGTLITLATKNLVQIYAVGFGDNINTNDLQRLASQTGGQYYTAASASEIPLQFENIAKNLNSQYLLRWATMQRATPPADTNVPPGFQPSFQVTVDGYTASWNTNIAMTNICTGYDTNTPPQCTNSYTTNFAQYPFNPPDYATNVNLGRLFLAPDADVGPQIIRLQADYVPRNVRAIRLKYRPNYPCTATLESTGTNEILYGWSLTETNDSTGLRTLTLLSSNTNILQTSIPYGAFGRLVAFEFTYPESVTATQAFNFFTNDNSIYTNMLPNGQSFVLTNAASFITSNAFYASLPPYGTPIPWLMFYGFTNNFAAAELSDPNGNGMPVWQDYLAGLNPTNVNSRFIVWTSFAPGQTPQITFNTVTGRTYRVETATPLGSWWVLRDYLLGTGGNMVFIDNRNLSGVSAVFYRVAVY